MFVTVCCVADLTITKNKLSIFLLILLTCLCEIRFNFANSVRSRLRERYKDLDLLYFSIYTFYMNRSISYTKF